MQLGGKIFLQFVLAMFACCVGFAGVSSSGKKVDGDDYNVNKLIENFVDGREYLYYSIGHHGYSWTTIVRENDGYAIMYGCTRDKSIHKITKHRKSRVLEWGFDSLRVLSSNLITREADNYITIYENIGLYFDGDSALFKLNDMKNKPASFHGMNSEHHNEMMNKLNYFMYWICMPEDVQGMLPTPKI